MVFKWRGLLHLLVRYHYITYSGISKQKQILGTSKDNLPLSNPLNESLSHVPFPFSSEGPSPIKLEDHKSSLKRKSRSERRESILSMSKSSSPLSNSQTENEEIFSKDKRHQSKSDIRDNEDGMEENTELDPPTTSGVNPRGTEREAITTATQSSRRRRHNNNISETSQRDGLLPKKSIQKRKHNILKEILLSFLGILGAILLVYACLYFHYNHGHDSNKFKRISRNSRYH